MTTTPKPKKVPPKLCKVCLNTIPDCSCETDKELMAALGFKNANALENVDDLFKSLVQKDIVKNYAAKYNHTAFEKAAKYMKTNVPPKKNSPPAFHSYQDTNAIMCPVCMGYRMKQVSVTVYERATDADPIGTAVTINKNGLSSTEHLEGNPSPRKNAVVITFECIDCSDVSDLTIVNHKGVTDMHMKPHKVG